MSMRAILTGLAVAMLAGYAAAQPVAAGNWTIIDKVSGLDGSHEFVASVSADGPVLDILDQPKKPTLNITCVTRDLSGNFALMIDWPDFIDRVGDQETAYVVYKVDGADLQKGYWSGGERSAIQFGNAGRQLAQAWSASATLIVQVTDKHGGQEATFHIAGLDKVLSAVSQLKCGGA